MPTDQHPSAQSLDGTARRSIRVVYAGDLDVARAQFASDAPQLQLTAIADAVARARPGAPPAFDVAFLDAASPTVNAAALVSELRRALPSLPIVLALDPGRDDAARTAWQLRVDDYTVKSPGWLARLTVRLSLAIARHEHAARCTQLKVQDDRLRSIVETAPVGLARVARDGTVLAVNVAARTMIGAAANRDILKKPFSMFVSPADREQAARFIEQASDGTPTSLELSIARLAGELCAVEASAVPLPAHGDAPKTALLTFHERTAAQRVDDPAQRVAAAAQIGLQAELERRIGELEQTHGGLQGERDALRQAHVASQARVAGLEADCARLAAERDAIKAAADDKCARLSADRNRLALEAEAARAAKEALDGQLAQWRTQKAASAAIVAERDELRRSIEEATARHTTEMALLFAGKASLERRLQEAEGRLQREVEEGRAAHARELDEMATMTRRLEGEVQLLTCERDAALRALAASQEYETVARRWIARWFELEQAMHTARAEIQRLADWPNAAADGFTSLDRAPMPSSDPIPGVESPWN